MITTLFGFLSAVAALFVTHFLIVSRERNGVRTEKLEELGKELIDANQHVLRFYGEMMRNISQKRSLREMNSHEFNAAICGARDRSLLLSELYLPEVATYIREWAASLEAFQEVLMRIVTTHDVPDNADAIRDRQIEKYHTAYRAIRAEGEAIVSGPLFRTVRRLNQG